MPMMMKRNQEDSKNKSMFDVLAADPEAAAFVGLVGYLNNTKKGTDNFTDKERVIAALKNVDHKDGPNYFTAFIPSTNAVNNFKTRNGVVISKLEMMDEHWQDVLYKTIMFHISLQHICNYSQFFKNEMNHFQGYLASMLEIQGSSVHWPLMVSTWSKGIEKMVCVGNATLVSQEIITKTGTVFYIDDILLPPVKDFHITTEESCPFDMMNVRPQGKERTPM
jgi:uncharacterized surface protein with fasciclin (FAS1) repeats